MPRINKDNLGDASDRIGVILALARSTAKIAAAPVADLIDNGGGVAGDTVIGDIPLCPTAPAVGANVPTKAALETALGQVRDGLTEIAAKIIAIHVRVPLFGAVPVNNIGGAAADGTIAAITIAPAADNVGPRASRAGFNALIPTYQACILELKRDINSLATACGTAGLTGTAGGNEATTAWDHTYAVLGTDTGAAAADSSFAPSVAESTATLTAMRDAIKEMSTALNLITSDTTPAAAVFAF
jgi:hypothetical protein